MKATAQEINSLVLEKVTGTFTTVQTFLSVRFKNAMDAFHDTLESRKYRASEASRLSQISAVSVETKRVAALLLCKTSARVIEISEGLNVFKEQGWELKVEGDEVQAWTPSSTQALKAATNDTLSVLNGNYLVKVIPFELRGER